jgi:glycosyltransferase involved in cell wall biosynthesis
MGGAEMPRKTLQVLVVDMQPITPAVGGGRQRLLGLYHALGHDVQTTYVGSYDWPGESLRDQQLTPGLREIIVPLSPLHHAAARDSAAKLDGRVVIDCLFSTQVHLSEDYLQVVREHLQGADVVVFSHPWMYPVLAGELRSDQLVVYDSQNVEAVLRTDLHGDLPAAEHVLRTVVADEYALCSRADLILTCSHEDRESLAKLYDTSVQKMRVVPNGIFAFNHALPTEESRSALKQSLGVRATHLCIFVGSNYKPNNDAARFIVGELAAAMPETAFAVIGGCVAALDGIHVPSNVRVLGLLEESEKQAWLGAADVAVNPLTQGSGTSIKMFDFMAAGVPVVTTTPGARGIIRAGKKAFLVSSRARTATTLRKLLAEPARRQETAVAARKLVEDFYAWERISPRTGRILKAFHRTHLQGAPAYSVVIPSYERPAYLDRLFACLAAQTEKDFDVVVIDQSKEPWAGSLKAWPFPLTYVHTTVRGAVKARNVGAELATGAVIAFTDDDCEPFPEWLASARHHFETAGVVGVEGRVESDHRDDPEWRPVSNVDFAGLGFMTANLLVANHTFQQLDGFDMVFDDPHFREDTDFGWRMQTVGDVPYGDDVRVFHPAHRRDVARESSAERSRFFEKDALLFKKHPERYLVLFHAEGHWHSTPGFWENFIRGAETYGVDIKDLIEKYRNMAAH